MIYLARLLKMLLWIPYVIIVSALIFTPMIGVEIICIPVTYIIKGEPVCLGPPVYNFFILYIPDMVEGFINKLFGIVADNNEK